MIGGYERYFQIARCFRDEDLRADRQPEFTQLDLEMAFVEEDDVIATMEAVMARGLRGRRLRRAAPPWPRMAFDEAMLRFGSDRPDTRFGLEIATSPTRCAAASSRSSSRCSAAAAWCARSTPAPRELSRAELDGLNEVVQRHGAKAVAWALRRGRTATGARRSRSSSATTACAATAARWAPAGRPAARSSPTSRAVAAEALGALRLELGRRFGLIPEGGHDVLWVVDFPMFEPTTTARWDAAAPPVHRAAAATSTDPGAMLSRAYDLVVDGWELGGGSIRINTPEVQQQVFDVDRPRARRRPRGASASCSRR